MRRTAVIVPVVVIGLMVLPMATTSRSFGTDWTLHLWLVRQQQWNIQATGHPGLFVSAHPLGAFYPIFAFVGSGSYSVGGYLAVVLGDRPILAYKLLYTAGLCLGYGGMTWLSIQRGLRGWRAQIAGLIFVTGTYYTTDLSSRGDFGELMAVSAIPFILAAACAMWSAPRVRDTHVVALVVGVFVFTGSHNITLLWGTVFMAGLGCVVLLAFAPEIRRVPSVRRIAAIAGCAALGSGLNAWYLFPDLRYGFDTTIAIVNRARTPTVVDRYGYMFGLFRPSYPIRVTVEWTFVVWAAVVLVLLWRRRDAASKRLAVGVFVLGAAFAVLAADHGAWTHVPSVFYNVQFSRRLNLYVLISTALFVILALDVRAPRRDRMVRVTSGALIALAVFAVIASNQQNWRSRSVIHVVGHDDVPTNASFNRLVVASRDVVPPSWYAGDAFRDLSAPYVNTSPKRQLLVPLNQVRGDHFAGTLAVPVGPEPFRTNIASGPRFVRMTGIRAIGRTKGGFVVATRRPGTPPQSLVDVTIRPARTQTVRVGTTATLLSLVGFAALLAWFLAVRAWHFAQARAAVDLARQSVH